MTTLSMAEIVAKSPDPVAAIKALGTSLGRSQMLGPCDRAEIGEVIVMLCITQGITLAEIFRSYQISFGRLEKKIDAALVEFRAKGGKVEWLNDGSDGVQARARFTLDTESVETQCTVEEARKAGWIINKKWLNEPTTMLRARVKKRGILSLCPEIFFGELDDSERDTTPISLDAAQMASAAKAAAAISVDKKQPAASPAPPTPATVPSPAPATTPPVSPAEPLLPDDVQAELVRIIGPDNIPTAARWAVSVGWLKAGDPLEYLAEKHARSIIAKADKFQEALRAFLKKEAAPATSTAYVTAPAAEVAK